MPSAPERGAFAPWGGPAALTIRRTTCHFKGGNSMKRFLTFVTLMFGTIAAAGAQQVTIRWSDVVPATHPSVQMIEKIAANVKEKSHGLINIQSFPNGQLGSSRDTIDATANGVQQIVTEGAANFGGWVPAVSIVE